MTILDQFGLDKLVYANPHLKCPLILLLILQLMLILILTLLMELALLMQLGRARHSCGRCSTIDQELFRVAMKGDLVLVVAASASVHRQPFHVDRVALGLQGLDKLVCLSATHG